jgi:hypothetical protein
MIESVLVMLVACLLFFALFQYAHLYACKTILSHAAARAARARCVGFNEWMVRKSALVAAIPASGERLAPAYGGVDGAVTAALGRNHVGDIWDLALHSSTRSPGYAIEAGRIPEYMESINEASSQATLDYELWKDTDVDIRESAALDGDSPGTLAVRVRQRHPLLLALEALGRGELEASDRNGEADTMAISGEFSIESDYPLYLENAGW